MSPASFETPETLPEGRGLAVSQECQPGLLIPHPSQLAPDWTCARSRAALQQLKKTTFWMLLSQLDINKQNKVQSNKDGCGLPGSPPNTQLAGIVSLRLLRGHLNSLRACQDEGSIQVVQDLAPTLLRGSTCQPERREKAST